MTYFAFLALFVGIPIMGLLLLTWFDHRRGVTLPVTMRNWSPFMIILAHIIVAVIWTTPWDNYLVATRVWWYDPDLVTGIVLWYVPIEEYTFFVLQPIMTGLFLLLLFRHLPLAQPSHQNPNKIRIIAVSIVGLIWISSVILLVSGLDAGTYLGLELVWALPPFMLQLAFGADVLWRHRRVVILAIAIPTIYLTLADSVAINAGTWTIDPQQSFGVLIGGILPIEEVIFFLMTNVLVVCGITLAQSEECKRRFFESRLGQVLAGTP